MLEKMLGKGMEQYLEKRRFTRISCDDPLDFTVLHMEISEFKRIRSKGKMIDVSEGGIGVVTAFPLQPGHVLEWQDKHDKGHLHIGLVKWSVEQNSQFRAGLAII